MEWKAFIMSYWRENGINVLFQAFISCKMCCFSSNVSCLIQRGERPFVLISPNTSSSETATMWWNFNYPFVSSLAIRYHSINSKAQKYLPNTTSIYNFKWLNGFYFYSFTDFSLILVKPIILERSVNSARDETKIHSII